MATLKGLFAAPKPHLKNFVVENRKNIRQMSSKSTRSDVTQSTGGTSTSKSPIRSSKRPPGPPPQDGEEYPVIRTRLFIQCRNQSCQTSDEPTVGEVFLYPSTNATSTVKPSSKAHEPELDVNKNTNVVFEDNILNCLSDKSGKNESEKSVIVNLINNPKVEDSVIDSSGRLSCVDKTKSGATTNRSQSLGRKCLPRRHPKFSKKEPPKIVDPDCPQGHVAITDFERLEMLENLNAGYHDRIQDLNKLPVGADTLRIRTRRIELEKQLKKIEDGIKLFSKPKVYVKSDE